MSNRNCMALLNAQWDHRNFVCVGLDTDLKKIPTCVHGTSDGEKIFAFNRLIVNETHNFVCAYKLNSAFYEALGAEGVHELLLTIEFIHTIAPSVVVILDAKRGDIGNTNEQYAIAAFDVLGADAITVHPYLGAEALQPFLDRADKGIFVLCRTSNKGAGEFQDLPIHNEEYPEDGGRTHPLYEQVARAVAREWNKNGNCGLVVGATYPEELQRVRGIVGPMPLLIPGIGKQGGDVEKVVTAGQDTRGRGMIINSSSGIIFASNGIDFPEVACAETRKLRDAIDRYRTQGA